MDATSNKTNGSDIRGARFDDRFKLTKKEKSAESYRNMIGTKVKIRRRLIGEVSSWGKGWESNDLGNTIKL